MFKDTIKKILGNVYYYSFKYFNKKETLTIFLFHEITNKPSEFQKKYKIYHSISEFEKIIKWINKNYNIISPNEIKSNKKLKALITFDDGYLGSFNNGIPLLESFNIPSIHFLNYRPIEKYEANIVSTIDYLCNYDENFKDFFIKQNIKFEKFNFYDLTPKIFKNFLCNYKIPIAQIKEYQGKIVDTEGLIKQKDNKLVFFGNHFYDHWNILNLDKNEIENYYFKNKMKLEKYKNYIDIVSFTHGVPNINFNKNNLNQIISYNPLFIFFSGGGIAQYNESIFDRTFTTYNEIENKIFYFRKNKKYNSNIFYG